MNKEEIRKEFFKLRIKGHSYSQCRTILRAKFQIYFSVRNLKRWSAKLSKGNWDLRDKSRRPHNINYKLNYK